MNWQSCMGILSMEKCAVHWQSHGEEGRTGIMGSLHIRTEVHWQSNKAGTIFFFCHIPGSTPHYHQSLTFPTINNSRVIQNKNNFQIDKQTNKQTTCHLVRNTEHLVVLETWISLSYLRSSHLHSRQPIPIQVEKRSSVLGSYCR